METARMDNVLDRLDTAIKEYPTSIDTDALDGTDHRRLSEILAFTTTSNTPATSSRRA
jgi:Na+/phosphate symporter